MLWYQALCDLRIFPLSWHLLVLSHFYSFCAADFDDVPPAELQAEVTLFMRNSRAVNRARPAPGGAVLRPVGNALNTRRRYREDVQLCEFCKTEAGDDLAHYLRCKVAVSGALNCFPSLARELESAGFVRTPLLCCSRTQEQSLCSAAAAYCPSVSVYSDRRTGGQSSHALRCQSAGPRCALARPTPGADSRGKQQSWSLARCKQEPVTRYLCGVQRCATQPCAFCAQSFRAD